MLGEGLMDLGEGECADHDRPCPLVRRGGEGLTALDETTDRIRLASTRRLGDGPPDHELGGDEGGLLRRCIATGTIRPKESLIRSVVAPDGVVTVDLAESRRDEASGSRPTRRRWRKRSRRTCSHVPRGGLW